MENRASVKSANSDVSWTKVEFDITRKKKDAREKVMAVQVREQKM